MGDGGGGQKTLTSELKRHSEHSETFCAGPELWGPQITGYNARLGKSSSVLLYNLQLKKDQLTLALSLSSSGLSCRKMLHHLS